MEFTTNILDVFTKDADKEVYASITKSPWSRRTVQQGFEALCSKYDLPNSGEEPLFLIQFSSTICEMS